MGGPGVAGLRRAAFGTIITTIGGEISKQETMRTPAKTGSTKSQKSKNKTTSVGPLTPEQTSERSKDVLRTAHDPESQDTFRSNDMPDMSSQERPIGKAAFDRRPSPVGFGLRDCSSPLFEAPDIIDPLPGAVLHWTEGSSQTFGVGCSSAVRRVVRVSEWNVDQRLVETARRQRRVLVSDGDQVYAANPADLLEWHTTVDDAARILTNAAATTSPRCTIVPPTEWAWLTPDGLSNADVCEVPVPQSAVPHLVGKGGRSVREAEDRLGVIIGIIDKFNEDEALVTLVGPPERVKVAGVVLPLLAKGVRSVLSRISFESSYW